MNDGRDQSVERLLRRSLRAQGDASEGLCLDAEALAAWVDGGLGGDERAAAETHLSHCARCQMTLAAFARGDVPEQAEQEKSWRRWGLGWLVPLAAGAAAVAIWIAVPQPTPPAAAPVQVRHEPATPPTGSRVLPADPAPAAPMVAPKTESAVAFDSERLPSREKRQQVEASADAAVGLQPTTAAGSGAIMAGPSVRAPRPAAASQPPPPVSAAETLANARALMSRLDAAFTVIASPDAGVLWRFGGGSALQYSSTGGRQWETLDVDASVELTAGVSPSASVCWLVGRAGTVLRTTDGRRFQRVPFPEPVDLAGVASASDRAATVTASDGRVFRTADGGVTWN